MKKIVALLFLGMLLASTLVVMLPVEAETWDIQTVDSDDSVGAFTSLALDSSGYPHISYYDGSNKGLKYAKWTGNAWSSETVDVRDSSHPGVGRFTSLALDSSDHPKISYAKEWPDYPCYDLWYAEFQTASWSKQGVAGQIEGYTSLALDSTGIPHIAFCYYSGELGYVYQTSQWSWKVPLSFSSTRAVWYVSIALNSSDSPHISYYGREDGLKYMKIAQTYVEETVDPAVNVGGYNSLALDSSGFPHISYVDFENGNLKYAKWTGSAWNIEIVDSADYVGEYTSLALDGSDRPHISYYDSTNSALKYAKWTGSAWSIETVDSEGSVGKHTSLELDSSGSPHISYYDSTNEDLKYATLESQQVPSLPSAPSNLQATAGNGQVSLDWNAPSSDGGFPITNYKIYRSTTPGAETLLATVDNVLTYTDIPVTNDQTYYYQVSAVNSAGEGPKSNEASATPSQQPSSLPSAPFNLQAASGNGQVALSWNAPLSVGSSPISNYKIYRGTTSGSETLLATVSNVLAYTDTSVTNDQKYYYQVSAVNSVGEGPKSNEASATPSSTAANLPSAPLNLQATAGNGQVVLSWSAPSSVGGSITNYKIYRGTTSGGETLLDMVGNTLTHTDASVANGQTYYYQVSAVNSAGEGPKSNEASATPSSPESTSFLPIPLFVLATAIAVIVVAILVAVIIYRKYSH